MGFEITEKEFEQVNHSRCLDGKMSDDGKVSDDGKCEFKIGERVAMAKPASNERNELITLGFSLDLEKRMLKTIMWGVPFYVTVAWTFIETRRNKLEECKLSLWRRLLNISWLVV